MTLSRRTLLGTAGAFSAAAMLSACSGFTGATDDDASGGDDGALSFTTWGTDAELAGFRQAIASFEKSKPGTKVSLNAVPYEQMFTNVDAQPQSGNPPDVFRVPYYTFGSYAGRGQLLDLSSHLEKGFADRFTPQAWSAVQAGGKPFGVPHHTDTSVILYNKPLLASAGITTVPATLGAAWTWDQFGQAAAQLRSALPKTKYPFAYNWQGNGVTRWLSWLFEANGRFLTPDLTSPAINSAAGKQALDFTKSFFTNRLVPPNSSVKSTTYAADLWYAQTTAMVFGGAFMLPDADQTADFEWGATFSPRRARSAGDFGGNALVVTAPTKKPELATAFLTSLTEQESMRAFCQGASLLPTRADLIANGIDFAVRPDLSPVFLGQASAVRPEDSSQVASPNMSKIIAVLKNELETAFVGGRSTQATLAALSDGISAAVR